MLARLWARPAAAGARCRASAPRPGSWGLRASRLESPSASPPSRALSKRPDPASLASLSAREIHVQLLQEHVGRDEALRPDRVQVGERLRLLNVVQRL